MGQGFSLTTLSAGSAGIDVPELADLVYEKSMGTARFLKTIRARHHDGLVVVKVLSKPYSMGLDKYKAKIIEERKKLAAIPNALSYERVLETETNGYLVRQYLYSSLYDRISTRPFLEDIEKKWLAFQLLCAVRDCHAQDIYHGDIKTENTLVTSWNWLYLSDFSSAFKPVTLPEDNPADFSYFFDTAGRRTCYVAPERFLDAGTEANPNAKINWAMDVFSAGCVIAELFLESPIFNLSQMYKYKKGEYSPLPALSRIPDQGVREMLEHMTAANPDSRYTADDYLNFNKKKVFPEYFYSFLHQYMAVMTDPSSGRQPISGSQTNFGEADERIDRIYNEMDKISYFLGYENVNKPVESLPMSKIGFGIFPVHIDIANNVRQISAISSRPTDDGTLLFLTVVVSALRNTARSRARIRACDLLLLFAERMTDEAKLDRVLPYLMVLIGDRSDMVKATAIRTVTQLMAMVTVISPVNADVFPEYILPKLQSILIPVNGRDQTLPSPFVRATYAACLGSLATSASRFLDMVATLRADGTLPTADIEAENGTAPSTAAFHGIFDNVRSELVGIFEVHTKRLITDKDSFVRQALLGSVPELCMFFGTADSNDIILSHLNTYLNDRDWLLKCAFFDTIVGLATFLGGTSLEEFILPLMVQTLTDPEEFVVERVLRSLANMAELGLFQRSKTWELADVVGRFSMHPNIWIREAAAIFLSASTIYLSSADNQCIIMPLIRPYLKNSIIDFTELNLLSSLKRPLSRPVFDLALTWANKASKGVFWKSVQQSRTFSFGSTNQVIPTITGIGFGSNALTKVSKNDEDELWLAKLRNMGMTADDEFKLLALREYIWRVAQSKFREGGSQHPDYLDAIIKLRAFGTPITTVWFDEVTSLERQPRHVHKALQDARKTPHTIADALLDASTTIDDSISRRRKAAHNNHKSKLAGQTSLLTTNGSTLQPTSSNEPTESSPHTLSRNPSSPNAIDSEGRRPNSDEDSSSIADNASVRTATRDGLRYQSGGINFLNRKDTAKSPAETSTTSTNAFGRVEGPFSQTANEPAAVAMEKERQELAQAVVKLKSIHSYEGNDPSILKMLDQMYVENYPLDIRDFGPLVTPINRRKAIARSSVQATDRPWRPEGILVANFAEHVGPVKRVVVSPDHVFFITGGDDGTVKIWDTARLEKNIAHRSRQTHKHAAGAKVTALCFVENTHCFVSCATDGSVHIVKVDHVVAIGTASGRYGKLRLVRAYQLPSDEFAIWADHYKHENSSILIVATNRSRVLAIEIRDMKLLYVLENPVHHGTPTCFIVDRKHHWLLLATTHGVLDLWDLRFLVRLRAWGVPGATSISRMCFHPIRGRGKWVCVASGSGQGEVSVWDVDKLLCREVYRTGGSREASKTYEPWRVDEDKPEGMLGRFATDLESTSTGSTDRGIRAMVAGTDALEEGRDPKYGFLITGGADKKIRFWDFAHVENSSVISGMEADEAKPTFTTAYPTVTLTVHAERLPKPQAPTAPNAASGSTKSGTSKTSSGRPSRSTVLSMQQQNLLKSHLDSILDVALLESPYGMTVSVDRSGCTYVFQ